MTFLPMFLILFLASLCMPPLSLASVKQSACVAPLVKAVSPTHLSFIDTEKELGADIDKIESWINAFKTKVMADLYNQEKGIYATELSKSGTMSLQTRKEVAFGVTLRPLFEGQNIYIAVFWSEDNLTQAQMRTELFGYGGGDAVAGKIPKPSSLFYHVSCEACRGLKLSGIHYKNFQTELRRQKKKYLPEELVFYKKIIKPLLQKHPDGDFDIVSINGKSPALDTLVHEAHHAQYDSNPRYKKVLNDFWDKHIRGQRDDEISNSFNPKFSTYELTIDEFFAYLLQPKTFGQWNPIDKYKEEFLQPLLDTLKENDLWPHFYPQP